MDKNQEVERDHILPYGVAALILGAGTLGITFASLLGPDVSYLRSTWTAWLAMFLATWPILAFAAGMTDGPVSRPVWRGFWTAGFLAFSLHYFWVVYRTYQGDYGAIFLRQGTFFAAANFIATALWALDAVAVWLPQKLWPGIIKWLHRIAWLWLTVSFIVSTVFRPDWGIKIAGYIFAGLVVLTLLLRLIAYYRDVTAKPPAGSDVPQGAGAAAAPAE